MPPNRSEISGALNRIIEWVQKKSGKPLLLIVDGLDKAPTSRAKSLFADSSLLTDPLCATVYTAPIVFYHRAVAWQADQNFNSHELLPNVAVQMRLPRDKNFLEPREPSPQGLAIMREVVEKRLAKHGRGVDDVIEPEAMKLLAHMSGGVMRQLIKRFNLAATFAKMRGRNKIDLELAERSVMKHRNELSFRLNADLRKGLLNALRERTLCGGAAEPIEDEMLANDYLLSYLSGNDAWCDVHPNLLPLLRG